MNRGAKFEMYIHSDYAYGAEGGTGVPLLQWFTKLK